MAVRLAEESRLIRTFAKEAATLELYTRPNKLGGFSPMAVGSTLGLFVNRLVDHFEQAAPADES